MHCIFVYAARLLVTFNRDYSKTILNRLCKIFLLNELAKLVRPIILLELKRQFAIVLTEISMFSLHHDNRWNLSIEVLGVWVCFNVTFVMCSHQTAFIGVITPYYTHYFCYVDNVVPQLPQSLPDLFFYLLFFAVHPFLWLIPLNMNRRRLPSRQTMSTK